MLSDLLTKSRAVSMLRAAEGFWSWVLCCGCSVFTMYMGIHHQRQRVCEEEHLGFFLDAGIVDWKNGLRSVGQLGAVA